MEQTFYEEIDETLIKEECIEERDLKPDEDSQNRHDITIKCGEIFIHPKGRSFTFICAICSNPFESLESFGQHVEFHLQIDKAFAVESNRQDQLVDPFLYPHLTLQENDPPIDIVDIKREEDYVGEPSYLGANDKIHRTMSSDQNLENVNQSRNNDYSSNETSIFHCPKCDRSYKYRQALKTHVKKEHERKEDKLLCKICGRRYMHIRNLRRHVKIDHGVEFLDDEESPCRYCNKTFLTKGEYNIHVKSEHPGNKKYPCPHCSKYFKCTTHLMYHIHTHTGERPFKCNDCDKAFCKQSSLNRHIRIHMQIKDHTCTFCSTSFVSKGERKRHEEMHGCAKPLEYK